MTEEQVRKAEKELLDAMKNCDVNKLEELIHDDLLFSIPNGQTITKAEDIATYRSGNMKIHAIKASEEKIHLIGDTAIVSVAIAMEGTYFEHALDGKYKIIRI
jgi:ketosteroid isomerase-like protein